MNSNDDSTEIIKDARDTFDHHEDQQHAFMSDDQIDDSDHEPKITVVPIDKEAPSPDYWYHGRLDRIRSEERLKKSNCPGSFLVRESDRKPGSFVLCYLSYKSTIYHFKITAVLGDYYIGGRQFDRLETLISYYMYYSELVKGEKLVNPIPPPIVCRLERICYSIKPYKNNHHLLNKNNSHGKLSNDHLADTSGGDEREEQNDTMLASSTSVFANKHPDDILYFEKIGQLFKVIHQIGESEWLWAQSFETDEYGLILAEYVEFIDDYKLHEIEPWFYPDITKESAACILASAGPLSYLVRPSDQSPDDLTLYLNIENVVHRYKIICLIDCETDTKYYQIGGRDFSNVTSIIERYMNEEITEGYTLSKIPHIHNEEISMMTHFQKAQQTRLLNEYNLKLENLKANKTNNALLNRRDLFGKKKSSSFSIESLLSNKNNLENSKNIQTSSIKLLNSIAHNHNHHINNGDRQTAQQKPIDLNDDSLRYNNHYSKISDMNHNHQTSSTTTTTVSELEKSLDYFETSKASASQFDEKTNTLFKSNDSMAQQQQQATPSLDGGFSVKTNQPSLFYKLAESSYIKQQNTADMKYEPEKSSSVNMFNKINILKATKAKLTRQSSKPEQKSKIAVTKSSSSPLSTAQNSKRDYLISSNKTTQQQQQTHLKSNGDQFVKDGYLSKYNEKTKKWKLYHFMLYQSDQQLYYFSNNKRLKEKGLIDLCYGYYYPVDDSYFNRSFCFQIIIHWLGNGSNNQPDLLIHYLSADSLEMFKDWTDCIRPLCNPVQFNPFTSIAPFSLSNSPSLSLSSTSATSSSSSPQSLNDQSPTMEKIFNKNQSSNDFYADDASKYRVLRTLNLDIHEARNVCFSPLIQATSSTNGSNMNHQSVGFNGLPLPPKYHKDNLYYCLVLFNNEAFVASTRFSNTTSNTINISSYLNNSQNHNNHNHASNGNDSTDLNSSNGSSSNCIPNESNYTSKDTIWDDSFSFDNLPLDVHDVKICLFLISKRFNLSASFVNNLKKIGGSSSSSAYSNTKMFDPILVGFVNIKLNDLINKGLVEKWYTVEPTVNVDTINDTNSLMNTSTNCTIRIKVRFCEEKIYLNTNSYKLLNDYLLDENEHKHICTLYEQIIPSSERPHFVHALLRFYIVKNRIVDMLKSYLLTEIDKCADLSTIFRPATLCTSLMDNYMRTRCDDFLAKSLQEPLIRILRSDYTVPASSVTKTPFNSMNLSKSYSVAASSGSNLPSPSYSTSPNGVVSFELDPSKCPDVQQRDQNLYNFKQALKELINTICSKSSVNLFPSELKYLFYLVKQRVHLKWQEQREKLESNEENSKETDEEHQSNSRASNNQDDKQMKIYCVSAFVFLRLLCPAMLNPKSFGLKFFNSSQMNNNNSNLSNKNATFNNITATINGLTLESPLFHNNNITTTSSSSSSSSTSTSINGLNGDSLNTAKHQLTTINYPKLANQFSVFSPSFMFSLTVPNQFNSYTNNDNHFNISFNNQTYNHLQHLQQQQQQQQSITASTLSQLSLITNQIVLNNLASTNLSSSASSHFSLFQTSSANSSNSIQLATTHERHIKLLAKVLQTLANMTECKESFMLKLSDFLNANRPNLIKFIEDISSQNEFTDSYLLADYNDELSNQFSNASCKYLSILHRLLNSSIPNMKAYLLKSSTAAKKSTHSSSSALSSSSSSSSSSRSTSNDSSHENNNTNNSVDSEDETINNDEKQESSKSFETSIHRLISILNDTSNKTQMNHS